MGRLSSKPLSGAPVEAPGVPVHRAEHLMLGKREARIVLDEQVYTLRVTRAGKLILTK